MTDTNFAYELAQLERSALREDLVPHDLQVCKTCKKWNTVNCPCLQLDVCDYERNTLQ